MKNKWKGYEVGTEFQLRAGDLIQFKRPRVQFMAVKDMVVRPRQPCRISGLLWAVEIRR